MIQLLAILITMIIALLIPNIPYINILIKPSLIYFTYTFIIIMLTAISPIKLVKVCMALFIFAAVLSIAGYSTTAETIGIIIYGISLAIFTKNIISLRKNYD